MEDEIDILGEFTAEEVTIIQPPQEGGGSLYGIVGGQNFS